MFLLVHYDDTLRYGRFVQLNLIVCTVIFVNLSLIRLNDSLIYVMNRGMHIVQLLLAHIIATYKWLVIVITFKWFIIIITYRWLVMISYELLIH